MKEFFMISKISKLLIASVLVALNISSSNCMESIKQKDISKITHINTTFSYMLKIINDAELCKEQCDKQAHEYRAEIDSIKYKSKFKRGRN